MAPVATVKSTIVSTAATVINNIIGGGLLALPFTFKRASLVPGVIAMCVTGTLNCVTMILIGVACEISGARNYKELGHICFGERANVVISTVMALYTLGSCVSYIVLIGDNLPLVILRAGDPATSPMLALFSSRSTLAVLSAALVLFPLSAQRNLNALRYTARVAFCCILYTAGMIASRAVIGPIAPPDKIVVMRGGTGLFIGFPITMVAFTMHYNTPRFYFELENHTPKLFGMIATACFAFTLIIYQATAVGGYLLFGTDTKGDVLENFADDDNLAFAARVALSCVMLFSYPLAFNSYRASFVALLPHSWQLRMSAGPALAEQRITQLTDDSDGVAPGSVRCAMIRTASDWPHLLVTAVLVTASVAIAIAIPEIELVLGYKGALGGTLIVYVLPGLMFFTMMRRLRAQGLTLADIARVKVVAGEDDSDGHYMPAKLVVTGAPVPRQLEPGEIQLGPPTPKMSMERIRSMEGLGLAIDEDDKSGGGASSTTASTPAPTLVNGAPSPRAGAVPVKGSYTPLGWSIERDTEDTAASVPLLGREEGEKEDSMSQFLAVPVRSMRSRTDTAQSSLLGLDAAREHQGGQGDRGGTCSCASTTPGTWLGDLLNTKAGWLAMFLTTWGLMVMVLGTATTAGLIQ